MDFYHWTNALTIKLVKQFEKRPGLWDPEHEMYRVPTYKMEAWNEMAEAFKCDTVDLKKKMNSVLASHRRERAKVRGGGRSTWFLYNALKFIPNHISQPDDDDERYFNETKDESDKDDDDEQMNEASSEADQEPQETAEYILVQEAPDVPGDLFVKEETTVQKTLVYDEERPKKRIFKTSTKPARNSRPTNGHALRNAGFIKKNRPNLLTKVSHEHLSPLTASKSKDECDSFGDYIATSLRKHDEKTRSMIKHAINNILFEQEMKKYRNHSGFDASGLHEDENPLL